MNDSMKVIWSNDKLCVYIFQGDSWYLQRKDIEQTIGFCVSEKTWESKYKSSPLYFAECKIKERLEGIKNHIVKLQSKVSLLELEASDLRVLQETINISE